MAISLRCGTCSRDYKLGTEVCAKCGGQLGGKYKVAVKNSKTGKWKSQMVLDLDLARKVEAKFISDFVLANVFNQGVDADQGKMTVGELWSKYYEWAKQNKRSYRDDHNYWVTYYEKALSRLDLTQVSPHIIQNIITTLQKTGSIKLKRPYAPATLQHIKMFASRLFNWAKDQDLFHGDNPASNVKVALIDNRVTNPLAKDEIRRMLAFVDTWDNERAALVIKYALFSGRRRGEILNLKWDDVDLKNGFVTYVSTGTKNKTTQTLPLNEESLLVLLRARELRKSELVFPCQTGKYYKSFSRTWGVIRKHLKLTQRFHDLRHTFATYLASSGKVDIYTLQHLLGHKDIKMTQRYAHLLTDTLKKAVNSVSYD